MSTMSTSGRERLYRTAVVSFVVAIAGGITAATGYATDETGDVLGLGLAAALTGIGVGLVSWAKFLDLDEHVEQRRSRLTMTDQDRADLREEIDETVEVFGRRRLLLGLSAGSVLAAIVGFVGPIGSLGPKPRGERARTAWTPGARLVTIEGIPVDAAGTPAGELVTVFPEGFTGLDDSQVVVMKLPPEDLSERTRGGATDDGWVAYSKICTHAGCSVGLLGIDTRPPDTVTQLVCPCHQSIFDPLDGARPVGGPAPRSLPQLPLAVDDDGYLIATAAFDRVVGPLAWDEA